MPLSNLISYRKEKIIQQIIPINDHGLFSDKRDVARADSRFVAQEFGKRHADVLRDIGNLDCSPEFNERNFALVKYKDEKGETRPCYAMTRDGFMFLVMGYRGKKVAAIKEAYIKRFNEMESFIRTLVTTRKEFPLLTENIKLLHENPKPYHFSNECDLINKIVTGYPAKKFRELNGIPKGESIRPFLTDTQIELMDTLQKVDIGLLVSVPEYEQRKRLLEWYKMKFESRKAG